MMLEHNVQNSLCLCCVSKKRRFVYLSLLQSVLLSQQTFRALLGAPFSLTYIHIYIYSVFINSLRKDVDK